MSTTISEEDDVKLTVRVFRDVKPPQDQDRLVSEVSAVSAIPRMLRVRQAARVYVSIDG